MYATRHATIESCCQEAGIGYVTFSLWVNKFEEIKELYKKSRMAADEAYWETKIKPKAKTALETLLEVGVVDEIKEEDVYFMGAKAEGVKKTKSSKRILPNAAATIFSMKGLFPERFGDKLQVGGIDGKDLFPQFANQPIQVEILKTVE